MASQRRRRSGQATLEFALTYVGIVVPFTFGILFLAEALWVWHSVVEWTRDTARYASTHCYESDAGNVTTYATTHVPVNIDQLQFQQGPATMNVQYFSQDPSTSQLTAFAGCQTECSVDCVPDAVTVSVTGYTFSRFLTFLKLPPITLPPFPTSLPMESAGCDPQAGSCNLP